MFLEFVKSCNGMPGFEVAVKSGGEIVVIKDIVELHAQQLVGTTDKGVVALNMQQIHSMRVPPEFEEKYSQIMKIVDKKISTVTGGEKNLLSAKTESLYNTFHSVLKEYGVRIFQDILQK